MKNLIVFLIVIDFISCSRIYGQETNTFKNHIGINVISFKYVCLDKNCPSFKNKLCFLDGLVYKRDFKHFTTRFTFGYNRFKKEVEFSGPDSYYGAYYYSTFSIAIGIQKNHSYSDFRLFYGIDLSDNPIIYKIDLDGGIDGDGQQKKIYENWVGINPIIGIQYNVTRQLSLSVESSYTLVTTVLSTDYNEETERFRHYLNPINAFSVFYNF